MKDKYKSVQETKSKNTERVVRATFSLPGSAIKEIETLREKLGRNGQLLNKSEVVRVGLAVLDSMTKSSANKFIGKIERLKAGRPNLILDEDE
jgi:hypothetical protein